MSAMGAPRADLSGYVARGYNLMATALLLLTGLAFGTLILVESDLTDRLDDGSLLLIAVIALVWYLKGDNRFRLTLWPVALTAVALLLQAVGVMVENADSTAVGDNFGGLILYLPLFVFLLMRYMRTRDILDRAEAVDSEAEEGQLIQFPAA